MKKVRIEDICLKVSSGGTPSRANPDYYSSNGNLWVKSKELLENGIYDTEEKITDLAIKNSSAKYYPENTILLAMYGANVGQLAWLVKPATVNQAICAMVPDSTKVNYKYFYYNLLVNRSELTTQAHGAAQQNLNAGLVKNFELLIPPLDEQERIANLLSNYDNLIENNNCRIAILEEMAQSLYREWFVNFRYPNHQDNLDAEGKPKLIDSPLGQIPEGWEVKTVSENYDTSSGGTPSRNQPDYYGDDHWWVKTKELKDGFVVTVDECISKLGLKKSSAKLFPKHTVVMAMYGATIGRLGILSAEASTNQACCAFLPKGDEMSNWYIYLLLLADRKKLIALGQGAAQQNISQSVIKSFNILQPPKQVLKAFNEIIEPVFLSIENFHKRNLNLKQQRDMLLPKLISGQIEL